MVAIVDVEAREQRPRRQVRQQAVRLVPDLARRRRAERQVDSEHPPQLQVRPDVQRVADEPGDGRRPRGEALPRVGVAGDEPLVDPGQAHRPPLVVVVLEPELGERPEHPVVGDVSRREVVVEVDDREALGDLVEQRAGRLAGEEEVVVEQAAAHALRSSWRRSRRRRRSRRP